MFPVDPEIDLMSSRAYTARVSLDIEDLLPPIALDLEVCLTFRIGRVIHGRGLSDDHGFAVQSISTKSPIEVRITIASELHKPIKFFRIVSRSLIKG